VYTQVEPETGQTAYIQVEPDTGQTVHMQVEQTDVQVHPGQTAYAQVEPNTGQIAFTSGRQKTGTTMQSESRDPRSYPIQTACIPTGSNVQVEPTDAQVHPSQTAHLSTGSSMQIELMDPRSRSIQTACTPPDAVVQQETSNGRQEQRQRSPPDTAARVTVDTSARPTSGRTTTQPEEDKITVEEELSSLQLKPEVDLQSPAVIKRQRECRIVTQVVIEPELRGNSSATDVSAQEQTATNKPEVAEPHQQLTAPEKTELEELQKANAAMNRQLSGFYPMPYFEPGRPLTPGVAAGPDVQMYARHADAYGTYIPSFYSPPGYTQCVYPNGVQYTPLPEVQCFSHPDKAFYAYLHGATYPSQEVEVRQVGQVSSDRQQPSDFSRQPEMDSRTAMTRPVVQFSDMTSENTVAQKIRSPDLILGISRTLQPQSKSERLKPEVVNLKPLKLYTILRDVTTQVAERSRWLNRHREPKRGRSYNTIVKNLTTMTSLNNDTRQERWKRMQKRVRPDIRHAIPTARLNEWSTRWMQKWARLNIHRLRSRTARHRTPEVVQLTVPLVTRSDNQQAHPEIRRQKIKDVTGRRIRAE